MLLISRGHRLGYCPAAHNYTHAPESFAEFYNQRRRWVPSIITNTLDLISNSKHLRKVNKNITRAYVVCQAILLLLWLLGSGTIFLIVVGALQVGIHIY